MYYSDAKKGPTIPNMIGIYDTTKVPGHYETDEFVFFWAGPFSNWHESKFEMNNVQFTCSEQAMMYFKAGMFKDDVTAVQVLKETDPAKMKALGRAVKNYVEKDWVEYRELISDEFLYCKFTQNPDLQKILLDTHGKHIVEASPYDAVWGIKMGVDNKDILDPSKWKGTNLLGESLMRVREYIMEELEN